MSEYGKDYQQRESWLNSSDAFKESYKECYDLKMLNGLILHGTYSGYAFTPDNSTNSYFVELGIRGTCVEWFKVDDGKLHSIKMPKSLEDFKTMIDEYNLSLNIIYVTMTNSAIEALIEAGIRKDSPISFDRHKLTKDEIIVINSLAASVSSFKGNGEKLSKYNNVFLVEKLKDNTLTFLQYSNGGIFVEDIVREYITYQNENR